MAHRFRCRDEGKGRITTTRLPTAACQCAVTRACSRTHKRVPETGAIQDECRASRNWTYSTGRVAAFAVTDPGLTIDLGTGGGHAVAGFCWLAAARRDPRRSEEPGAHADVRADHRGHGMARGLGVHDLRVPGWPDVVDHWLRRVASPPGTCCSIWTHSGAVPRASASLKQPDPAAPYAA